MAKKGANKDFLSGSFKDAFCCGTIPKSNSFLKLTAIVHSKTFENFYLRNLSIKPGKKL